MVFVLLITTILTLPPDAELMVIPGYGAVVWETGNEPPIISNTGIYVGGMRRRGLGRIGGGMLINAYSGDARYHVGPGSFLLDVSYSWLFEVDRDVYMRVGAGGVLSVLFSRRIVPDGPDAGTYLLVTPGLGVVGAVGLEYVLHPRIRMGINIRYYDNYYAHTCWSGPTEDCSGLDPDHFMQHWFVGFSLIYVHNPSL